MIKNINSIKKQYIRLSCLSNGELAIEVCIINWHGPHTPIAEWKIVKKFDIDRPRKEEIDYLSFNESAVSIYELENEISKILTNRKYFQICGRCRTLNPIGHMYDDYTCQDCGSKFEGADY